MKNKKLLCAIICLVVIAVAVVAVVVVRNNQKADPIVIAIPNDPTNEGRALLLLETNGYIKLKEDAGITATVDAIAENPLNLEFKEAEAAMLPNLLADVDYAIINNNYALDAKLDPTKGLLVESSESPYVNVISVKAGNEETPAIKALVAAVTSQKVVDYINETYGGAAIATVENPTDGYDETVDYEALKGTTISIVGTPTPHVEVLNVAAEVLAEKEINLNVITVTDYVTPNTMVEAGEVDANYFAHQPYQDNFNAENGTNVVTVAGIHVEPMAMYGGKQTTLDALKK